MGYWDRTVFVAHDSMEAVCGALVDLFEAEGCLEALRPPRRDVDVGPMLLSDAAALEIWGVALRPGAQGWTAIKTAPFDLLIEAPAAGEAPRLVQLAQRLSCDALQLNVYDGECGVLVEASATGYSVSGDAATGPDARRGLASRGPLQISRTDLATALDTANTQPPVWLRGKARSPSGADGFFFLSTADVVARFSDPDRTAEIAPRHLAEALSHVLGGGSPIDLDDRLSIALARFTPLPSGARVLYFRPLPQ